MKHPQKLPVVTVLGPEKVLHALEFLEACPGVGSQGGLAHPGLFYWSFSSPQVRKYSGKGPVLLMAQRNFKLTISRIKRSEYVVESLEDVLKMS